MSRKMAWLLLVVILIASVANFIYWTNQKAGYHCDEIYSHGLSNTDFHYRIYDDNDAIRWNTSSDIDDYLIVPRDGRFDFINVYKNQIADVHPPLFYIIMHASASLIPEAHSVYVTAIPNMLFTLGTCIFLYLIVMELTKKRCVSLFAVACFAFSVNAVNMVMYMRMYAQLAFFTTVASYLHIKIFNSGYDLTPKLRWALFATVFLGTYTHYYFLIFIVVMALYMIGVMKRNEQTIALRRYLITMGITASFYVAVWPVVFKHLFFTPRGGQAFGNAIALSMLDDLRMYIRIVAKGSGSVLMLLFLLAFVICAVFAVRNKKVRQQKFASIYMLMFVLAFYVLLVSKVAPFRTDRYISPVFPLFMAVLVYFVYHALQLACSRNLFCKRIVAAVIVCAVVAGLGVNTYDMLYKTEASQREDNYLFRVTDDIAAIQKTYEGKKCVMVNTEEWQFLRNLPDYKVFGETAFICPTDISRLKEDKHLENEQEFIVYIYAGLNTEYVANMLMETTGFDCVELLTHSEFRNRSDIYRIYKK